MDPFERTARLRTLLPRLRAVPEVRDYRDRVRDGLHEHPLELPLEALDVLDRLAENLPLSPPDLGMAEAIILPLDRPVARVQDDTWEDLTGPYRALNAPAERERLRPAIRAVGRIDIPGFPTYPYAGTGFLVGPGLLLTNRHVARLFASGVGEAVLTTSEARAAVDFRREYGRPVTPDTSFSVDRVLWIHPHWDAALVRISGQLTERPHLQLATSAPVMLDSHEIVVVGYPGRDARNDLVVQDRVFGGVYQVKRFQPGRLAGQRVVPSFAHEVEALCHDASTLGGNSGSAVLDLTSGAVLGLHFGGNYLDTNYAVPAWELARDPRVVDAGVALTGPAGPTPAWVAAWEVPGGPATSPTATAPAASSPAATAPAATSPAAPSPAGTSPPAASSPPPAPERTAAATLTGDWWERTSDVELRRVFQEDPPGAWEAVRAAFGEDAGRRWVEGLAPRDGAGREGVDAMEAPAEPVAGFGTVVLLHGFLGGHLHDVMDGAHLWLDPARVLFTDLGPALSLRPDGLTDLTAGQIAPAGPLRLAYGEAIRAWSRAGFAVRPFAYDWRKSVEVAADALHTWLEATLGPTDKVTLVAHSMGGLVCLAYAARHPEWERRVARAVLVGTPARGTFAPVELLLGEHPLLRKLVGMTGSSRDSLRAMVRTLPGVVDLMPDPAVFPEVAPLYEASGWPTGSAPAQAALDRARALKLLLAQSPLRGRVHLLVGAGLGTVDHMDGLSPGPRTGPGDGTVPIAGALLDGVVETRLAPDVPHPWMLTSPAVVGAVRELLLDGEIRSLPPYDPAQPPAVEAAPAGAPTLEAAAADPSAADPPADLRARLSRGEPRPGDVWWLLDPEPGPVGGG